ncbi:hypothetical protein [Variovorax sp. PBL-H6]|uniref:hypothetical protein n=2 Tax=Variovorax TaxID=34072 RepID=UPI0013A55F3D|nr:hypothetical protein [Variovorax sp. PBL-H6]
MMVEDESKLPLVADPLVLDADEKKLVAAALLNRLGLSEDSPAAFRDRCEVIACYDSVEGTDCYYHCIAEKMDGKKPSMWK